MDDVPLLGPEGPDHTCQLVRAGMRHKIFPGRCHLRDLRYGRTRGRKALAFLECGFLK
jgi:hypothetical protein